MTRRNKYWNDYSSYIKRTFGERVQKISVNAGFTCPNRDSTKGLEGCIYCINESFSPFYCNDKHTIEEQLIKGIEFFGKKYKSQKYLAYFQSYTNTYSSVSVLEDIFTRALQVNNIIGLVIATRPDCINDDILALLKRISESNFVSLEFGAESTNNHTLKIINRGHSWEDTLNAVEIAHQYGIKTCLHMIIGLPGEKEQDFYEHANKINRLPINSIKIHQMQVLKGTKLEELYYKNPEIFLLSDIDKYAEIIVNFCELLNPEIIIERFTSESPKELLIAPNWQGKKNFEVSHIIAKKFMEKESFQGKLFLKSN